jgi:hypothetical protein
MGEITHLLRFYSAVDNVLEPMELAHLPYRKGRSYEDYVGLAGLERLGKKEMASLCERGSSATQERGAGRACGSSVTANQLMSGSSISSGT